MSLRSLQASLVAERQKVLQDLGLSPAIAEVPKGNKKRQRAPVETIAPLRRSSRSVPAPGSYTESRIETNAHLKSVAAVGKQADDDGGAAEEPRGFAPAAPGSLRSTIARVEYMTATYLGHHIPIELGGPGNQAKRAVRM